MLSFVFVVTSLCLMGVMSIGNIKIRKRNGIIYILPPAVRVFRQDGMIP